MQKSKLRLTNQNDLDARRYRARNRYAQALQAGTLKPKLGFTLIEMMVAITIVGFLATLGIGGFIKSQKRGRDTRRMADMKKMQNIFEQYYAENNGYSADCEEMTLSYVSNPIVDPKGTYSKDCDNDESDDGYLYCVCANLEVTTGNADDGTCGYDDSGDEGYFCVNNLQ